MCPKFEFDDPKKAQDSALKGSRKKGANRFDLSGSRVKDAADTADKFQFADAPKTPGIDEASMQIADKKHRFGKQKDSDQGPLYGYDKHRLHKGEEVSVYNEQQDAKHSDPRNKKLLVMAIILVVSIPICTVLPNYVFSDDNTVSTFADLVTLITVRAGEMLSYISGSGNSFESEPDIWRYIIIALSGAALGMTGAVYQGSLKNALASPTTLGVTAGGTLGAMIYIIITYSAVTGTGSIIVTASSTIEAAEQMGMFQYFLVRNGQALASLAGCAIVVVLVLVVAHIAGHGKLSSVALIVCGQVMMMTINGAGNLIRYYYASIDPYGPTSQALRSIRSYSFNYYYLPIDALFVAVPIVICIVIIMRLRLRLSLLTFSDDEARSMGLSVTGTRNLMVGVCTLMTAVVISFGGNTGFVGFLVPHITRRIIGPDFKYLVPASALLGSSFLVIIYYITSLFESLAGGVGFFTSIFGGIMFIAIALNSRGKSSADGF